MKLSPGQQRLLDDAAMEKENAMTIAPDYSDLMEEVAKVYGPKALAFLERVRVMLEDDGYIIQAPPFDMSADDYRWCLIVQTGSSKKDVVDISIEIAEEREYDGGEGYGLNFGLDIVESGGRILGGLTPYNYTKNVWVDARDPVAVSNRWWLIEESDIESIAYLLNE